MKYTDVMGYCPLGCGEMLFIGEGGYITCCYVPCPRPDAVSELLSDRETEHVVQFEEESFTLKHPLRERLDDPLFTCQIHERIAPLDGPPARPGRYRVTTNGEGDWRFTPIVSTD